LLGHVLPLWRQPTGFLRTLSEVGSVVRIYLGTRPVYFLTSPELIHHVLVTAAAKFSKGRIHDLARPLLGNGLLTADGEQHRRQRRLIQPAFHRDRVARYGDIMSRQARRLANSWQPAQRVAVETAMHDLTLDIAAEALISATPNGPAAAEIHHSLPIIAKHLLTRAICPKVFDALPIPINRAFDDAAVRIRGVVDDVIGQHISGGQTGDDLLSMLIAARDVNGAPAMSVAQLRDELISILMAGTETTATTLSWAFHELGHHPDIADQLRSQIDTAVGRRPITVADLPKLDCLRQVLNEVTRLHSVLLLMRRVIAPVDIGAVRLAPGAEVAFSPYALHRDQHLFPDAQQFDPGRWARGCAGHRTAFIPFGDGNRKCIGDAFAWTEMSIVLATITARWRLMPDPGHTTQEVSAVIPRPDALPMITASP